MLEKLLSLIALFIIAFLIGFWSRGHEDKVREYTGAFGDYFTNRYIERQPVCPAGYTCIRQEKEVETGSDKDESKALE